MTTQPSKSIYLGDGVYLSTDGYQLWLAVGNHQNRVMALDRDVFTMLIDKGNELFDTTNNGAS